jgi:UDP-N-acetylglucosamine transferase subunit ALG13
LSRADLPSYAFSRHNQPLATWFPDGSTPGIFLTVGTDHHPFDRLVGWLDAWLQEAEGRVSCIAQIGPSRAPINAHWTRYLTLDEVRSLMNQASVVVTHAGAASVLMARDAGHCPVVVPRRKEFGEAVDNHQLRFSRWLESKGFAYVAEEELSWRNTMEQVLANQGVASPRVADPSQESVLRFGKLVDALLLGSNRGFQQR